MAACNRYQIQAGCWPRKGVACDTRAMAYRFAGKLVYLGWWFFKAFSARCQACCSFQSMYLPWYLAFMKLSNWRCMVRFHSDCALMRHDLSYARSDTEKPQSTYCIQCHHALGMNKVSPCSSVHSMPSMCFKAGKRSKSGLVMS